MRGLRAWWSDLMNRQVKVKQVAPAYVILAVGLTLGAWQIDQLSQQRLSDVTRQEFVNTQTQCISRVQTRADLRGILLSITDLFPPDDPNVAAVVLLIENDYPPLSVENC